MASFLGKGRRITHPPKMADGCSPDIQSGGVVVPPFSKGGLGGILQMVIYFLNNPVDIFEYISI